MSIEELVKKTLIEGNIACASKLMTMMENGSDASRDILKRIFLYTDHAHIIGITGGPGT